ncbi:hypothetical protein TrST_g5882, partial [Triparma strigata]
LLTLLLELPELPEPSLDRPYRASGWNGQVPKMQSMFARFSSNRSTRTTSSKANLASPLSVATAPAFRARRSL